MTQEKLDKEKREKELLSKYYKLSGNNVEVTLVYNTFAELVDSNFGDDRVEKLNTKLFNSMDLAFKEIPVEYAIYLNVKIKDFGSYNEEEAMKIIRENIEMRLHTVNRIDKKQKSTSTWIMLIGLLFIIASYFVPRQTFSNIVYELVDLCGQIFVWEGMYAYFLNRTDNRLLTKQYRQKLHSINISKYGETNVTENISLKKVPQQKQPTDAIQTQANIINTLPNQIAIDSTIQKPNDTNTNTNTNTSINTNTDTKTK